MMADPSEISMEFAPAKYDTVNVTEPKIYWTRLASITDVHDDSSL